MQKTVVLNVVALSPRMLGEHTPFLTKWAAGKKLANVRPVLPAVTCAAHATYLTGQWPETHGVVGNGWYFRDECEVKFWRQSNKLVEAPKIWDAAKALDPTFTCANMFWWYNMYSTADYSATPRPQYLADGRKMPDMYTHPADLRDKLQASLGTFPLFNYWGPTASIKSSQWIADASIRTDGLYDPTLTLIYLPHLDYNLQKFGPDHAGVGQDLGEIDRVCEQLITYYEGKGAQVVVLSEYGITPVNRAVHLNRVLRQHGYMAIREERGLELLDAGASEAFAVADHQVAHIYVRNPAKLAEVRQLIEQVPGVGQVLGEAEKTTHHLNHDRAGELIAIADRDSWFTYYFWLDDSKAPDYARMVDIHKKPGYDPVEMFVDPTIKFVKAKVGLKVLKKKLGFRMTMDVIPLDASLIKGSHGRIPESEQDWPLLISGNAPALPVNRLEAPEVYKVLLAHLTGGSAGL